MIGAMRITCRDNGESKDINTGVVATLPDARARGAYRLLPICVSLLVFSWRVCAAERYVSLAGQHSYPYTNWADAATNIAVALEACVPGDTVSVTDGLYHVSSQLSLTQGVQLVSVNGASCTIVDGQRQTRCIYVDDSQALVDGFTFRNGYSTGTHFTDGGGVFLEAGTVRNCIITGNVATTSSGPTYHPAGGGVLCMGLLEDSTVSGNLSSSSGGGVAVDGGGVVMRCRIDGNSAEFGGGLAIGNGTATACVVKRNNADTAGGVALAGGGTAESCLVLENDADIGGGVVMTLFGGTMRSCTVSQNSALDVGGVLAACWESGVADIENTVIYGNENPNYQNSTGLATCAYSCMFPLVPGIGNITNDPQLTPSYRLKSTSPCIDAGTALNGPLTDIDGEARWDHPGHSNVVSIVDIGADEFVDADLDDMADYWETETLGGTTNSNGTADDDNDGLTDLGEYENDTDPGDADSDADQMPDGWEVGNALDPLADDAGEDPDSDTMSNRGEYVADTDPRNPESVLSVTDVAAELGGIRIDWKGGRQAWQFLECRPGLITNAPWTPILAIPPPTPLTNAIIDFGNGNQTLFYRIRAER